LPACCCPWPQRPRIRKSALDKPTLEAYVRHLFVWGPQIKVEISSPKPSPLPVDGGDRPTPAAGNATQDEVFYISKDGQTLVRGSMFDVKDNPFKPIWTSSRPICNPASAHPARPWCCSIQRFPMSVL